MVVPSGGGGIDNLFAKRLEDLRIRRETEQLEAQAALNASTDEPGDDEDYFEDDFEADVSGQVLN